MGYSISILSIFSVYGLGASRLENIMMNIMSLISALFIGQEKFETERKSRNTNI